MEAQKLEAFINYVENHDIPRRGNNIRWCDIDSKLDSEEQVYSWFKSKLKKGKISLFLARIDNYKSTNPSAYKKVLYKLKFAINAMKQKSEARRLVMFLNYIKKHDIPERFSNVRWIDLDKSCDDDSLVSTWFSSNIQDGKFELFMEQVEKYAKKESLVYQKINNTVKLNGQKRSSFTDFNKVAVFMKYIENNPVPVDYSSIKWCDIYKRTINDGVVCFWVRYNLKPSLIDSFFVEIKKYKKRYPKAYDKMEKIILRLKDKRTNDYTERKMEAFFKYIDKKAIPKGSSNICWSDISSDIVSDGKVGSWFMTNLSKDKIHNLAYEAMHYSKIYPAAYKKVESRIYTKAKKWYRR